MEDRQLQSIIGTPLRIHIFMNTLLYEIREGFQLFEMLCLSVVVDQSGSLIDFQINGAVLLANCLYRDAHNIVTYSVTLLTEL